MEVFFVTFVFFFVRMIVWGRERGTCVEENGSVS